MAQNDIAVHVAPRRVRWRHLSLLLVCIIVVGGVLEWQIAAHTGNSSGGGSRPAATPPSLAVDNSGPLTPPVPLTATYDERVKEHVAQGLHLTVAQVTVQLQSEPTPDLREIGKQQGLAQDRLYRLVLSALQTADDQMVTSGVWTQRQADEGKQYWGQQTQLSIISGVAGWFLQRSGAAFRGRGGDINFAVLVVMCTGQVPNSWESARCQVTTSAAETV
jgi:hypothetical protein